MFGISGAGYDMSTSIFSPEGRIFAAEYAKKAVEQGATSIGVLVETGVVLLAEKKLLPLQEPDTIEKISQIDTHIAVATSGLMADARRLVQEARIKAQSFWLTYEEPIPGEALTDHICDIKAQFTQGGGARPYGVAMIVASVDYDKTPHLYVTDPVGTSWGFLAAVIGRGSTRAGEYLEKHYKKKLSVEKAIQLAIEALRNSGDVELTPENVEIAMIPTDTAEFQRLDRPTIAKYLSMPTKGGAN